MGQNISDCGRCRNNNDDSEEFFIKHYTFDNEFSLSTFRNSDTYYKKRKRKKRKKRLKKKRRVEK